MAETRVYRYRRDESRGHTHWPDGHLVPVTIYRHRGTWAYCEGSGWMWCRQWGFRTARAALLAASRWLPRSDGYRLVRRAAK